MLEGILVNDENLFLIALGFIWIIGAVMQDMKRREVDNIWNFSLIAFALGYRAAVSIGGFDYWFILNGLIGFGIFIVIGNLFYYSRLFAGGDAKLLMALGTILPLSYSWIINFKIFGYFIILFLMGGSVYALIYSLFLVIVNRKKFKQEFSRLFKVHKNIFWLAVIFFAIWFVMSFIVDFRFLFIGIIMLIFPFLFVFAKAVEEACLVRLVNPKDVTVGDWLYKDIKIKNKKIKASWDGVSPKELKLIQKQKKKIMIKYGIPFTPSFFIAFIGLIFVLVKYVGLF